jgi:hypothetical protein
MRWVMMMMMVVVVGGGVGDCDYDYQKLLVTMTCAAALHAAGHQPSFQESKV